jgi:hypothetical protein
MYVIICLIIFVSLLILVKYYMTNMYEGFHNKENIKCDSHGCPITKYQNDIYKIHVGYKPIRDKNHMIAHNTKSGSFLHSTKGPENIFIIRHGEKLKTKTGLDCNGVLRSTYIPDLIESLNNKNYGIHSIITAYDYSSMHEEQTVSLTSWLLSIPTFIYGEHNDTEIMVKQLFSNPYFNGKTVLICWEHNCIQILLENIIKIGSKAKGLKHYIFKNPEGSDVLPYWDTNNYKTIFHLDSNLNFDVMEEKFTTCYSEDNDIIKYNGKKQKCK